MHSVCTGVGDTYWLNQLPIGSPCLRIAQFVKNYTVSVQFSYVALYAPLEKHTAWLRVHLEVDVVAG